MVDSVVKSATVQSLEAGVIKVLAGVGSGGISTLEGVGVASGSTNGVSGGGVTCVGWTTGVMCLFEGWTVRISDSEELSAP